MAERPKPNNRNDQRQNGQSNNAQMELQIGLLDSVIAYVLDV